jgi:hypothetical protein
MAALRKEMNLKIDDFGADPKLSSAIKDYFIFLTDYMGKIGVYWIVHTCGSCMK